MKYIYTYTHTYIYIYLEVCLYKSGNKRGFLLVRKSNYLAFSPTQI